MHLDNQPWELVGRDLVMPHIAADDLRDLIKDRPAVASLVLPSCSPRGLTIGRYCGIGPRSAIIPRWMFLQTKFAYFCICAL
jgi:hypothetical protein